MDKGVEDTHIMGKTFVELPRDWEQHPEKIATNGGMFQLLVCSTASAKFDRTVYAHKNYPFLSIEYVIDGAGYLECNGESYYLKRDSVYFLHRNTTHRYYPDPENPWTKIFFVARGCMLDFLVEAFQLRSITVLHDVPQLRIFFERMLRLSPVSSFAQEEAGVIFHDFALECRRATQSPGGVQPPFLEELHRTLTKHIREPFSLKEYAQEHNLSTNHLIRTFHQKFDKSPVEYLLDLRLAEAERLLIYSDFSVKEIAHMLCFANPYSFSNFFKQRKGTSPKAFRCCYGAL